MTETLGTSPDPRCECCGRGADVAVRFPATANEADADFQVCLRCVPLELRGAVVALPGHEQLVELMLGFAAAHLPTTTPPAAAANTR